jgi:hypothetical protein
MAMGMAVLLMAFAQLLPSRVEAGASTERDAIRKILLGSRHLGAHGLGYNAQSQAELAKQLSPAAVPTLLTLLVHDQETSTGAIFGLASQCGAAIMPILDAAQRRTIPYIRDALTQMEHAAVCSPSDQQRAVEARMELDRIIEDENERRRRVVDEQHARRREVTTHGLMLLDPDATRSVSANDCLAIVVESARAGGIDPSKSESSQQLLNLQIANCYHLGAKSKN